MTEKMPLIMGITIVSAVLLLRTGQNTKIKGDAMMAMISVGALAIGYLIMNLFSTAANLSGDVCSTLFGSTSILTLTKDEVWFCAAMSAIVVVIFILFYNKIFAITFDEDFSRTAGTKAGFYNLMLAIIIAVVIVLAMNLVGALLTSALIIFPALSAMRIFRTFRQVIICAAVYAVVTSAVGILISIILSTPTGATIVVTDLLVFGICSLIGKIKTC